MLASKTVFVIGAGASAEVNLPVGAGLKSSISRDLKFEFGGDLNSQKGGSEAIYQAFSKYLQYRSRHVEISEFTDAAWHIGSAMPNAISIDNFIDSHRDNKKIEILGKLGIANAILSAESSSDLRKISDDPDATMDFERVSETWYSEIFKLLHEGRSLSDVEKLFENSNFVIFNYDRCLEYFLYYAIRNYYGTSGEEAANLIRNANFFHPYGQVGDLPEINPGSVAAVPYGANPMRCDLMAISQELRTFTERHEEGSRLHEIRNQIASADQIIFLGFAYHKQNIELLASEWGGGDQKMIGTAVGISDQDCVVISKDLGSKLQDQSFGASSEVLLDNSVTCQKLFSTYWRSITD